MVSTNEYLWEPKESMCGSVGRDRDTDTKIGTERMEGRSMNRPGGEEAIAWKVPGIKSFLQRNIS